VVRGGCAGEGFRGEDVVGDGGERVVFQKRDVLEGGGLEDEAWSVRGEDVIEEGGISGAAENGRDGGGRRGQVALQGVEIALGRFEQDEHGWSERGETQREGRADGAARAGDEDGLASECGESLRRRGGQARTREEAAPVEGLEGRNHRRSINWDGMRARAGPKGRSSGRCGLTGRSHTLNGV